MARQHLWQLLCLLLAGAFVLGLQGCGQPGRLYLPDQPQVEQQSDEPENE